MEQKGPARAARLLNRREILAAAAMGIGALASLTLVGRLLRRERRSDAASVPLPGEGSIFQPRRDARLEEWERTHPR
ncbi:MAG: hypothetical protein EXR48_04425 [Dehalococcoidia bacterium]|nr:hypothetical protein [Dehalococcoidia bacterium]